MRLLKPIKTIYHTIRYAVRSIRWLVSPPRCQLCGSRMHTAHPTTTFGKLTVQNMYSHVCNRCISIKLYEEEITGIAGLPFRGAYDLAGKCDCCGHDVQSYRFMSVGDHVDLRFSMGYWNGFKVCERCVIAALSFGSQTTDRMVCGSNIIAYVSNDGLLLDGMGKVKLFQIVDR